MKCCEDCRWCVKGGPYVCAHRQALYVTDDTRVHGRSRHTCHYMRYESDACGAQAKLFSPSLWCRLLGMLPFAGGCNKNFIP